MPPPPRKASLHSPVPVVNDLVELWIAVNEVVSLTCAGHRTRGAHVYTPPLYKGEVYTIPEGGYIP